MLRLGLCCLLLSVSFLGLGCGSGSGIESGIPADTSAAPVNPTPDMEPDPVGKKPTKMP